MDEIEKKKLEVIKEVIGENFQIEILTPNGIINATPTNNGEMINNLTKEILSALKQFDPEPLEVEIRKSKYDWFGIYFMDRGGFSMPLERFLDEQEALEWCELKGLNVKK